MDKWEQRIDEEEALFFLPDIDELTRDTSPRPLPIRSIWSEPSPSRGVESAGFNKQEYFARKRRIANDWSRLVKELDAESFLPAILEAVEQCQAMNLTFNELDLTEFNFALTETDCPEPLRRALVRKLHALRHPSASTSGGEGSTRTSLPPPPGLEGMKDSFTLPSLVGDSKHQTPMNVEAHEAPHDEVREAPNGISELLEAGSSVLQASSDLTDVPAGTAISSPDNQLEEAKFLKREEEVAENVAEYVIAEQIPAQSKVADDEQPRREDSENEDSVGNSNETHTETLSMPTNEADLRPQLVADAEKVLSVHVKPSVADSDAQVEAEVPLAEKRTQEIAAPFGGEQQPVSRESSDRSMKSIITMGEEEASSVDLPELQRDSSNRSMGSQLKDDEEEDDEMEGDNTASQNRSSSTGEQSKRRKRKKKRTARPSPASHNFTVHSSSSSSTTPSAALISNAATREHQPVTIGRRGLTLADINASVLLALSKAWDFIVQMHRLALSCDREAKWILGFTFFFPEIVKYTIGTFAPSWASVCLFYAFLIQVLCTGSLDESAGERKTSFFRKAIPLAFLLDGVSHPSLVLGFDRYELLITANLLMAIKCVHNLNPAVMLTVSFQILFPLVARDLTCNGMFYGWSICHGLVLYLQALAGVCGVLLSRT